MPDKPGHALGTDLIERLREILRRAHIRVQGGIAPDGVHGLALHTASFGHRCTQAAISRTAFSPVLFELDRLDVMQGRSHPRLPGRNRQIVPAVGHEDMETPLASGPIAVLLSLPLHPLLAHANALTRSFRQ